ncbi:MAG: phosphoribosylglycinamide formyltransferase [Chthonomonadales bacterium]|nr:phosphoribosylglycinamide formyltransferase [Chthonomonadales bacterium]
MRSAQNLAELTPTRIAVMVSGHGRGSNMQAIIDGCRTQVISGDVVLVIGTRKEAPAIARAASAGIPVAVVRPPRDGADDVYAAKLLALLDEHRVDLICLAGYMRLLPSRVVSRYRWRIMNVHPGLLPAFGGRGMYGMSVHEAVLASGATESGCTVHFVDEEYDHGSIILQTRVPVLAGDTAETLAARILPHEHRTYVEAVRLFAEGRLRIRDGVVEVVERSVGNKDGGA